jgi:hypothetical protein
MSRNVVHLAITTKTRETVREIGPRTNQDGTSWQWYSLISQSYKHAQNHSTSSRVASQNDGVRVVLLVEQV